jgi:hypothetical protein
MSRRKWSRERIIEDITRLQEEGYSLSTRSMAELGFSGMVTTSYKPEYFGSWRNAIVAAGFDPKEVCRRKRKWTAERILQRIQELHKKGEDLSHSAAKRNHQYLVVVAINSRFFGSWREAVEAAGIDYEDVSKHEYWSRERISERILPKRIWLSKKFIPRSSMSFSMESSRDRRGSKSRSISWWMAPSCVSMFCSVATSSASIFSRSKATSL